MSTVLRSPLPEIIDELWERRTELTPADEQARAAVVGAVDAIDAGQARVAVVDPATGEVVVDERAKRAILLAFRVLPMARSQVGDFRYDDRVPLTTRLDGVRVAARGDRALGRVRRAGRGADAVVRQHRRLRGLGHHGGHLGHGRLGRPDRQERAPVGRRRDRRGARAAERGAGGGRGRGDGRLARHGGRRAPGCARAPCSAPGAILAPTTHVIDTETGAELPRGEAPPWSVCVGGTRPRTFPGGTFGMPCVLVLKRLPEGARHDKAALNAILRDHGVDAVSDYS